MPPNFVLLNANLPDVARLVAAMTQARDAVENRSWSHPQEPTTEEWWADVLADPRARIAKPRSDYRAKRTLYRLTDEPRETILVACSKCDSLLNHLAAPGCPRLGSQWDRCGVHYVEPIAGG